MIPRPSATGSAPCDHRLSSDVATWSSVPCRHPVPAGRCRHCRPPARAASDCAPAAEEALTRIAAAWRAGEFDAAAADAREAYALAPACVELGTASWAGSGWNAAATAAVAGGSADSLAPVREALDVLESAGAPAMPGGATPPPWSMPPPPRRSTSATRCGCGSSTPTGLGRRLTRRRAAVAAAVRRRGRRAVDRRVRGLRRWPQAAFERALADAPTPVAMRGLARARARRGNVAGACAPFARALDLVAATGPTAPWRAKRGPSCGCADDRPLPADGARGAGRARPAAAARDAAAGRCATPSTISTATRSARCATAAAPASSRRRSWPAHVVGSCGAATCCCRRRWRSVDRGLP